MGKTEMELVFNDETHTYSLNGIVLPSVTQVLKAAGLINLDFIDKNLLAAKADLGKKVHTATELYDDNTLMLDNLDPVLNNYLMQWVKFKIDFGFEPTDSEVMLHHKLFRYAGRIDRAGWISTRQFTGKVLIDIKSGAKHHSHAIQTAAYMELYNSDKKPADRIRRRYCVYLTPDSYQVQEYNNPTDKNVFLSALTITNYLKQN